MPPRETPTIEQKIDTQNSLIASLKGSKELHAEVSESVKSIAAELWSKLNKNKSENAIWDLIVEVIWKNILENNIYDVLLGVKIETIEALNECWIITIWELCEKSIEELHEVEWVLKTQVNKIPKILSLYWLKLKDEREDF